MNLDYCHFIAGCFGGGCGVFIGHPLNTIKTWQQATNSKIGTSIYEIIVRNNGLNGFYRGMTFPLLTTGAINTLFFGIYGNELRNLQSNCNTYKEKQQKWGRHVLYAGSIAGLVQSFIACPTELITIRLQTRNYYLDYRRGQRRGPIACIKQIFRSDGVAGFYRGLSPTLCRDVIPYGIYMLVYEKVLNVLGGMPTIQRQRELNELSDVTSNRYELIVTALSGTIAGVVSWILAIPFDVLKTIMQADAATKYDSMAHCIKVNMERHSWTFLFRGSWMIIFRAVPVNCATFLGYEYILGKCKIYHSIDY